MVKLPKDDYIEKLAIDWNVFNEICKPFKCEDCPKLPDCEYLAIKKKVQDKLYWIRYLIERDDMNEKLFGVV